MENQYKLDFDCGNNLPNLFPGFVTYMGVISTSNKKKETEKE